jgi:glycosyltransferase involved in cell wall biosynthesis
VRRFGVFRRATAPALTISHLEGADYVNILSGGPGKRLLCIHGSKLHDANIRGPLGWIRKRLLIPVLYNRADRIVTVSYEIATELKTLGVAPSKLTTIHNFFDSAAIRKRSWEPLTSDERAMFEGPPVLVTSARLTVQKNLLGMVAIFARLLERRRARLVLIGDGELREILIEQARGLGLRVGEAPGGDHDLYVLGFQENPFRLQRHADIFLLTSGWEGFPMVLGEAMACGLPIVSADCPTGPREFLAPASIRQAVRPLCSAERGDYGVLMPIPDEAAPSTISVWVDELDRLLGDEEELRKLSEQALDRAQDFSRENGGAQWLRLIDELLTTSA